MIMPITNGCQIGGVCAAFLSLVEYFNAKSNFLMAMLDWATRVRVKTRALQQSVVHPPQAFQTCSMNRGGYDTAGCRTKRENSTKYLKCLTIVTPLIDIDERTNTTKYPLPCHKYALVQKKINYNKVYL